MHIMHKALNKSKCEGLTRKVVVTAGLIILLSLQLHTQVTRYVKTM